MLNRDVGNSPESSEFSRGAANETEPRCSTARVKLQPPAPLTFPCEFPGICGSVGAPLAGSRALGVIPFSCGTGVAPYIPNETCHFLHLFCKCLLSAYHFPIYKNVAEVPAKTQRPQARVSLSPVCAEGRVPGSPTLESRESPADAAPGLRAPEGGTAHAHAHARERRAPPSSGLCRRRARAGARESKREAVAAGGAGARERRSCIRSTAPEAPPQPRPPLLPRAGSARPKSRACARVRRPGPSGGGPVDSNESVARSRINPFPAHPFRGPVGFRACASRRRAFPLARTAHAREGGVPVGVFTDG